MASEIRVNQIQSRTGVSTVSFTDTGPIFAGVSTVQGSLTVDENLNVGGSIVGNLNITGVLTYDDVTNVDSIGVITARSGIHVTGGNVGIGTESPHAKLEVSGGQNQTANQFTDLVSIAANANNDALDAEVQLNFGISPSHTAEANRKARIQSVTHSGTVTPLLINPAGGAVGIGTDNPGVRLHVRNDSGELARFQINDQTASGRITCIGGTASYSGINFGDVDNVDAGRIRHYNDDNSNASGSFLLYTNDTVRIALNRYGLLTNYPGSNSAGTGGTILGRYKYTQQNESQNYEHLILGPDGRKLQDLVDTNCFCVITICVTGTGTNNMFCQYHYHANQSVGSSTLTHIAGNDISSSNRPYMVLVNTHDPAWKMNHNTGYTVDIEVAIYGGNDQYTYTTQFGEFGANP